CALGSSRRADNGRGRLEGLRLHRVVRRARTRRTPAGGGEPLDSGARQNRRRQGGARADQCHGLRCRDLAAGQDDRENKGRLRKVGSCGQRSEHQGGIAITRGGFMHFARLCVAALAFAAAKGWAEAPLERGKYLVEGILTCGNCHTPRGPGGTLDTTKRHAGGPQVWDTAEYHVRPSNITPDKVTGIGKWTAAQVKAAIRDGKRPDGTQLSPQMPSAYYRIFTPADLDAVVAYTQSIPPVSRKVDPPVYKVKPMVVDVPPGAEQPMPDESLGDPVKKGFYLATIGHCMECHTPAVDGHRDFKGALGTGGEKFPGPWGV